MCSVRERISNVHHRARWCAREIEREREGECYFDVRSGAALFRTPMEVTVGSLALETSPARKQRNSRVRTTKTTVTMRGELEEGRELASEGRIS